MTRSIAPFLLIWNVPPKACQLDRAGVPDGVDGGVQEGEVGRSRLAGSAASQDYRVAFASFFTIRTSMPPSGALQQLDVVHEAANQEDAAAARFQHVLGRERVGDFLGLEALALVADADGEAGVLGIVRGGELDVHHLPASFRLPCLMALMTDSRIATLTQCIESSSNPSRRHK